MMLFGDASGPIYLPQDLATMQEAHDRASLILEIHPRTDLYANAVAKSVLQSYTSGLTDIEKIANIAVRHVLRLKRLRRTTTGTVAAAPKVSVLTETGYPIVVIDRRPV
jgi:hypothetical protein